MLKNIQLTPWQNSSFHSGLFKSNVESIFTTKSTSKMLLAEMMKLFTSNVIMNKIELFWAESLTSKIYLIENICDTWVCNFKSKIKIFTNVFKMNYGWQSLMSHFLMRKRDINQARCANINDYVVYECRIMF